MRTNTRKVRLALTALTLVALVLSLGLELGVGPVQMAQAASSIIEVSLPTYLTSNSEYDRNPSIIHDGTNYWLFWTKADNATVRGSGTHPDGDTYVVYYKTAGMIAGLASADEIKLGLSETARPGNFTQRVVSATYFDGKVYAFVSSGQDGTDRGLYYYEYSGGSWSGPTTLIADATARGGHVNVTSDASRVYIVWESSDGSSDCYTWNGSSLSSKIDISDDNMPKITLMGTTLYVVSIADSDGDIEVYSAAAGASPSFSAHSTAIPGAGLYDPCIFNDGTDLYVVTAPYDGGNDRQYLVQTKYDTGTSTWTTPAKTVSYGGYGGSYWWDYWPCGYHDGTDAYLFFTTETASPTYSDGEIAYIKMDWDLDNDHYFYIQNAINQATSTTINVAAGTYNENLVIDKSLSLLGEDKATTIIQPAGGAPGIYLQPPSGTLTNVTIKGFSIINTSGTWNGGIYADSHPIDGLLIEDNNIQAYNGVILINQVFDNVTIKDNNITEINERGVMLQTTSVDGLLIEHNTMTPCASPLAVSGGIYIQNVHSGTITRNTISGFEALIASSGRGISGSNNDHVTISNNTFDQNRDGITLWVVHDIDITGNQITNSDRYGINIKGQTLNIASNTVSGSGDVGINVAEYLADTNGVVIHGNSITGNTNYGVKFTESIAPVSTLDAKYNWWGSVDGPEDTDSGANEVTPANCGSYTVAQMLNAVAEISGGLGDKVSDNVDYCPWTPTGCWEIDFVNIGLPSSEAGHNLYGWGPIEPATHGGGWGGAGEDGNCRVISSGWDDGTGMNNFQDWAQVNMDFGSSPGTKYLLLRHLEGHATDSFYVYVDSLGSPGDGTEVFYWPGDGLAVELWYTAQIPLNLTGIHTIYLLSDQPHWGGWGTWGQVAFTWIKVCEGWYWKPDYPDYAPSGMPDFDQRQDLWGKGGAGPGDPLWKWTHCGPVAVANCLWWFDSKFDPSDMVTAYGAWDDHDPQNVPALVDDLAGRMKTNGACAWYGTYVQDMEDAIDQYLIDHGLDRHFYEHTVEMPTFEWVEDEVERSEDVILLLGFWQEVAPGVWKRFGGHYVTVAGVHSDVGWIAFSDPIRNNAEPPTSGPGRVRNGTKIAHDHSTEDPNDRTVHNDAGNVSHDAYQVALDSPSPGGEWWLPDYVPTTDEIQNFQEVNFADAQQHSERYHEYVDSVPVHTEVEYAVVISPKPVLWVEPDDGAVKRCENIFVDVKITANDMYGLEFDLDFDPTLLEVIDADPGTTGTQISVGSMWPGVEGTDYTVIQNTVNNTVGTIEFAVYLLHPWEDTDFHDEQVAQIEFHGLVPGMSDLDLNDAIVATKESESIEPVFLEDGTLTVLGHGTIEGTVQVQGRPGDWDDAVITVSEGPGGTYSTTVTDPNGTWSISEVVAGSYKVTVEMALYLDGLKTGVVVSDNAITILNPVRVLGGDCNEDDTININDATILGPAFGSTTGGAGWNPLADINDSGNVNILDAVLLGGNWHKSSPVNWP